ncbi:MAG: HIT domain-containing protein [Nitrospirae bacterium]|nr:HIT domain-containing protein [Nitrospirota bacterium]MBI3351585.1 HIT domain-containing protein [Nitrospirota bacterium]
MKQLWAPWRMTFIKSQKTDECIFCVKPKESKDLDNFILFKNKRSFVMMNIYPYNHAHLLVCPYDHVNGLDLLSKETAAEMMETVQLSISALKQAFHPDGFNIGVNMGKAAGAGIEDHVHIHIVPRWTGDTNFMPLLAEVKAMPEHLELTYRKILPFFK